MGDGVGAKGGSGAVTNHERGLRLKKVKCCSNARKAEGFLEILLTLNKLPSTRAI